MRERKQQLGFSILGLYSVFCTLYLIPHYNKWYRLAIGLSHLVLFFVSVCIIAFVLVPSYARKRSFGKLIFVAFLGLSLFFVESNAHGWRYSITDRYIEANYCKMDEPADDGLVLGGINEIEVNGLERTGAFENSSHCLFVVCEEEFFHCGAPVVVIGP